METKSRRKIIDLNKHMAWVVFDRRGTVPCMAADNETAVKNFINSHSYNKRGYYFVTDMEGNPAPFDQPHVRRVWEQEKEQA